MYRLAALLSVAAACGTSRDITVVLAEQCGENYDNCPYTTNLHDVHGTFPAGLSFPSGSYVDFNCADLTEDSKVIWPQPGRIKGVNSTLSTISTGLYLDRFNDCILHRCYFQGASADDSNIEENHLILEEPTFSSCSNYAISCNGNFFSNWVHPLAVSGQTNIGVYDVEFDDKFYAALPANIQALTTYRTHFSVTELNFQELTLLHIKEGIDFTPNLILPSLDRLAIYEMSGSVVLQATTPLLATLILNDIADSIVLQFPMPMITELTITTVDSFTMQSAAPLLETLTINNIEGLIIFESAMPSLTELTITTADSFTLQSAVPLLETLTISDIAGVITLESAMPSLTKSTIATADSFMLQSDVPLLETLTIRNIAGMAALETEMQSLYKLDIDTVDSLTLPSNLPSLVYLDLDNIESPFTLDCSAPSLTSLHMNNIIELTLANTLTYTLNDLRTLTISHAHMTELPEGLFTRVPTMTIFHLDNIDGLQEYSLPPYSIPRVYPYDTGFQAYVTFACPLPYWTTHEWASVSMCAITESDCLHGASLVTAEFTRYCDCLGTGYTGTFCEIDLDDSCHPSPCVHGTCVDTGLVAECACDTGYEGLVCDTQVANSTNTFDEGPLPILAAVPLAVAMAVLGLMYGVASRYSPSDARPTQLVLTGWAVFDFITDLLFIQELSGALFIVAAATLGFAATLNFLIAAIIAARWVRISGEWCETHAIALALTMTVSLTQASTMNLLNSRIFGISHFDIPITDGQRKMVASTDIVRVITEDLPQFAIQVIVVTSGEVTPLLLLALGTTVVGILASLVTRVMVCVTARNTKEEDMECAKDEPNSIYL